MGITANTFSVKEVNFCLDGNFIEVTKENENVHFLTMKMTLFFKQLDGNYKDIVQLYEYVFFENKVTLYPGEDVEDFFSDMSIDAFLNGGSNISPYLFFPNMSVAIEIIEYDSNKTIQKTHSLSYMSFLSGKKPKAFPYLTNGSVRRTYANSLISISAIKKDFREKKLSEISGVFVDNQNVTNPKDIISMAFTRQSADAFFNPLEIIKKENLALHPIPDTQSVINVIFQNQNKCPDWFSFSGEWEQNAELEHIISNKTRRGNLFKAKVNAKNILKLNTGWMFEEEVILLEELIKSPYCFVKRKEEWLRCIPISKKPISYDTERNVNSQIVKFQIVKDDER